MIPPKLCATNIMGRRVAYHRQNMSYILQESVRLPPLCSNAIPKQAFWRDYRGIRSSRENYCVYSHCNPNTGCAR